MLKAVVDIGSNSVLLLVGRFHQGAWEPVLKTSRVTGLGKGTKTTGLLSKPGMAATLEALAEARDRARSLGCTQIVARATMAARIASNTAEFLEAASLQGLDVQVLSGDDEAKFGFRAVVDDPLFSQEKVVTVIDVGGHSTELVNGERTGHGWHVRYRQSVPIGALGLREGALKADVSSVNERLSAMELIDTHAGVRFLPQCAGRTVTLGATGTNLVTVREAMEAFDDSRVHGTTLTYEEVSKGSAWLSQLGDSGRANLVGIEPGREHTIHAGALILERFMFAVGAEECTVSTRGWRHGLLASLA